MSSTRKGITKSNGKRVKELQPRAARGNITIQAISVNHNSDQIIFTKLTIKLILIVLNSRYTTQSPLRQRIQAFHTDTDLLSRAEEENYWIISSISETPPQLLPFHRSDHCVYYESRDHEPIRMFNIIIRHSLDQDPF